MKKLGAFILSLSFSIASLAGNPVHDAEERIADWGRSNQAVQDESIRILMKARCDKYFVEQTGSSMNPSIVRAKCTSAVASFMKILKPELVKFAHPLSHKIMSEPAAFTAEFAKLMDSPAVNAFLHAWQSSVEMAALGVEGFETYDLAKTYAGSDAEALRWMAVLFQDTSAAHVQLQWIQQKEPNATGVTADNIAQLEKVLDRMTSIFTGHFHTTSPVYFLTAHARAAAVTHLAMGGIYHYYVPGYVAQQMVRDGQPKALAMMLPFLFNYLYEAIEQTSALPRLVSEPASLPNVHDTYLGFLGTAFGIGFDGPLWNQKTFTAKMQTTKDSLSMMTGILLRKYPL